VSNAEGTRSARKAPKTWSQLSAGGVRRKPSEYEVVTHNLIYHMDKSPAPFELDASTPMNKWYLQNREGSTFRVDDWNGFRDPHRLTYHAYVDQQNRRETYLDAIVDRFEAGGDRPPLSADWVAVLERVYLASRYSTHVLQMAAMYLAQLSPSSYVANCAEVQAADEMRRIQRSAYRAKSLSLQFGEQLADTAAARGIWENDEAWQPLRKVLEELLLAYDLGEAFAALNLVVKPLYDAFFLTVLGQVAQAEGDEELALMLDDFRLDSERNKDWTKALVAYAVSQRPENREVLAGWVEKWRPATEAAIEAASAMLAGVWPADRGDIAQTVAESYEALLADCGLQAAQAV
jgi:toluene monooxygenase system protein E